MAFWLRAGREQNILAVFHGHADLQFADGGAPPLATRRRRFGRASTACRPAGRRTRLLLESLASEALCNAANASIRALIVNWLARSASGNRIFLTRSIQDYSRFGYVSSLHISNASHMHVGEYACRTRSVKTTVREEIYLYVRDQASQNSALSI